MVVQEQRLRNTSKIIDDRNVVVTLPVYSELSQLEDQKCNDDSGSSSTWRKKKIFPAVSAKDESL